MHAHTTIECSRIQSQHFVNVCTAIGGTQLFCERIEPLFASDIRPSKRCQCVGYILQLEWIRQAYTTIQNALRLAHHTLRHLMMQPLGVHTIHTYIQLRSTNGLAILMDGLRDFLIPKKNKMSTVKTHIDAFEFTRSMNSISTFWKSIQLFQMLACLPIFHSTHKIKSEWILSLQKSNAVKMVFLLIFKEPNA